MPGMRPRHSSTSRRPPLKCFLGSTMRSQFWQYLMHKCWAYCLIKLAHEAVAGIARTEKLASGVARGSTPWGMLADELGEDMTTALAKALVDGLGGEGVEQVWSKLNQTNAGYRGKEAFGDGLLFYVDPTVVEKRRRRYRRRARATLASWPCSMVSEGQAGRPSSSPVLLACMTSVS